MRSTLLIPGFFALVLATSSALAKAPAEKRPKVTNPTKTSAWRKELESGDAERILAALAEMSSSKDASAIPLIEELLTRGADAAVLIKACQVLADFGQVRSSAAIAPYVKHRAQPVRQAAVAALAQTKGPAAVEALRAALHGSDTALRGAAATGLGNLGAREAVPDLFSVLPKGVLPAAYAIGRLCSENECGRLLDQLGKIPFDTIKAGLEAILFRDAAEVSDDLKIRVVERVRGLLTESASEFLKDVRSRWPNSASVKVRNSLDAAIEARGAAK